MKPAVCHKATKRVPTLVLVLAALAGAQTSPSWRKVGGAAVDLSLASPATGPVENVWFSSGGVLFASTASGRIFQTADFESWAAAPADTEVPPPAQASAIRLPESGAQIVSVAGDRSSIFGLGRQVSRSQDGGHTWSNLTGYRGHSVIGVAQHSIAISPFDANQIVVANDYGVWRTLDGGSTWSGLNGAFPNLPVEHIVSTPTGIAGTRIAAEGLGELELPPGGAVWQISGANDLANQAALKQRYSALLGAEIRAVAVSKSVVYAGSKDGHIWVWPDGAKSFDELPFTAGGPVESIFADPSKPNVAVAAVGGNGPHVLYTFDSGAAWYTLDSPTLPNVPAHGVTEDLTSGSIYVATDKGVFFGHADLETASTNPTWQNLTGSLPPVPAADVRLDPAGVQLYIALEGYGVYAAAAPHISRSWRIVDAADSTVRPAAPGSLLSVLGANVSSASDGSLKYPVLMANENGSQIQVPFEATGSNLALAFDTADGRLTANLPMQSVSPAILLGAGSVPMLYDADTNLPLDLKNAAHSNGRVAVLATGLGRVHPDWPAGVPAPENAPVVTASVQAYLDGAPLQVTRATLAPGHVGFYLVELQLPQITNAGLSELHLSVDGRESNRVQLWIEP